MTETMPALKIVLDCALSNIEEHITNHDPLNAKKQACAVVETFAATVLGHNDALQEVRRAHNAYQSAVADAAPFTTGRRVESRRLVEHRLRTTLWLHRDAIADLIRSLLPES